MSTRRALTSNSEVRMPSKHGIKVCRSFVLNMPKNSRSSARTKSLVDSFTTDTVSEILRKCSGNRSPKPVAKIGQGGFGKVFGMSDGTSVLKIQVFDIKRKLDELTSEIFLGKLFGKNNIGPNVLDAGFVFTDQKGIAVNWIRMEKGVSLSTVLKKSSAAKKAEIMALSKRQYTSALNRMLTLGFACTDLKPSNTLYDEARRKIMLIDFSESFCPQVPMLVDRFASASPSRSRIVSSLPKNLRRDVIAAQVVMFSVTCKLFSKAIFAADYIKDILSDEVVLNNCHKICALGEAPDDYIHLTNDKTLNDEIEGFLHGFARIMSHNFRHYSQMEKMGTSLEVFVELLEKGL